MFRGFYLGTNSCENAYFNPLKYFNSLSSLIGTMLVIHKYIYILSTSNILGLYERQIREKVSVCAVIHNTMSVFFLLTAF